MPLFPLVALAILVGGPPPDDSLHLVSRTALSAVEADSAKQVRSRLTAEAATRPSDPRPAFGLAYLSLFEYDYADAARRFRLIRSAPGLSESARAYATMGLALTALGQGNAAEADSLLGEAIQAARMARAGRIEGEALVVRTLTAARVHGTATAVHLLARADSLIPTDDHLLTSRARCVRAQLTRSWDLVAALEIALAGAAVARSAGSLRNEGFCLGVAGWAVAQRGNSDSALALFGRAVRLQEQARDRSGRAATLQWQGYFLHDVGSYGPARVALNLALVEGQASGNMSPVAWAHTNLGLLTFATGELEEMASHVALAESLFVRQGDHFGLSILAGIAVERARAVGDTSLARTTAERFRRDAGRWGGVWPIESHRAVAQVAMDRGDWATARAHLDSALADARAIAASSLVPTIEQDLGILALRRGDLARARSILERVARETPTEQAVYRHYARTQLARVYLRTGAVALAAATAADAAQELDRWRSGLDDRRLLRAAFDVRPYEDPSFAVADIISGLSASGRVEAAFDLAERRRARHLLDRMVLLSGLEATHAQPDRPRTPVATSGEIRNAIPDDSTAILEFVRGHADDPTIVFVVTRSSLQAIQLPPARSLRRDVHRFIRLLESGASADSLAAALGTTLLAPVYRELPPAIIRLVVIPDLDLHGLPLEALVVAGQSVVERFAVSYAPSASVVARLWTRPRSTAPIAILAMGDPRFAERAPPGSRAAAYLGAFRSSGGLGRLRGAGHEARSVARFGDRGDVRLRVEASEAALKRDALREYRVVHLATHALVDDRSVTHTALALAPGDGEDGFVSPAEIAELKLAADLFVLSACRSGRGPVVGGEGIQGLAAPALEAGARAVLGSGWRVEDEATAGFFRRFYPALARGLSIGDALRATKLELRRAGAAPAVWASFTLVGDPHTVLALHLPPSATPPWLVIAAAMACLALAYGVIRTVRGRESRSAPSGSNAATTQR